MSTQELHSYRLSSLEDPTDEMLLAVMKQVEESARRTSALVHDEIQRRFDLIRAKA